MARPRFVATAEHRRMVRSLVAYGISQEEIARCVGMRSSKTLRRHFREELDRGATEANARVAQSLYQMAISGKCVAATIFWMKTRAWRESGSAPRPSEASSQPGLRRITSLNDCTDEELTMLLASSEAEPKQ
jgi:hypothetical protein